MSYRERRPWTEVEDQLLREAVAREDPTRVLSPSKWHAIAKHLPNRNNKDCRKRWFAKLAKTDVAKGNWSAEEDARLMKAIEKHGRRWTIIATAVQTRNSDQCAKRWKDTLNPAIDKTSWTEEEDVKLIEAVKIHGNVWARIARAHFPGRTGLAAKNRYNSITRGNGRQDSLPRKLSPSPSPGGSSDSPGASDTSPPPVSSSSPTTSPSPMTPPPLAPDSSSTLLSPSQFDLNLNPFSWSTPFSETPLETLVLDDLFTLPPLKYPPSPIAPPQSPSLSVSNSSFSFLTSSLISFDPPSTSASASAQHRSESSMRSLKLYGTAHCASTARVQIVLHEKNIPYEMVNLDTLPANLNMQPFSQTPVLEDDGFILSESRAICRYLATKYADQGTKLIPDAYNIKRGALFEQAVFTEVFAFEPYASKAVYEKVTKRSKGLTPDEAVFEGSIAVLSSKLEGYENILSRQKYLAGDELTLADLYHIPCGAMLTDAGSDIMTRKGPNITRWWTEISSRPSWLAARNSDPMR